MGLGSVKTSMSSSRARAPGVRRYFIDTGAFYAALDRRDPHHPNAVEVFQAAGRARALAVTGKWTVVETHTLILARTGRRKALEWLEAVPALVLPVEEDDEVKTLSILRSHHGKDFTLVDASSFALMERWGIRHYHSYDRHSRQNGKFVPVTASMF